MFDIITIGSATCDVFLKVSRKNIKGKKFCFELGKKQPLENLQIESGGGATNVACALASFGLQVAVLSRVGRDVFGDIVEKDLKRFNVNYEFLQKDEKLPTAVSAVISAQKGFDRTALVYKGACHFMEVNSLPLSEIKTKWLYIAPLREKSMDLFFVLRDFAQKNNIQVAANPSFEQIKQFGLVMLKGIDILFINKEEAKAFGKTKKILQNLNGGCLVITDGEKGAQAFFNNKLYNVDIDKDVEVIEKTGAGDAFASGFLACFLKNNNVEYCLEQGVKNSESVIQQIGAKNGLMKF